MGVIVRSAIENDLDGADRVLRLAFGTQRGLPDPMTAFGDRDMIKARYRGGTGTILVAEENSKVLGTTALTRWGSVGFIGRMAVDPALQGKGLASSMMTAALSCSIYGASLWLALTPLPTARSTFTSTNSLVSGLDSST